MRHTLLLLLAATLAAQAPPPYQSVARLLWLVRDIDKATKGWAITGNPSSPALQVSAGGLQARLATVRFANVSADFLQPLNSFPPFADFLKQKGPGVYSLLYPVASAEALEAEKKRLASAGVRLLFELTLPHPGGASARYAFFDTAAQGKYVLGLVLAPPTLEQNLPRGMRVTQFAFAVRELEPVSAFWTRLGFPAMTYTKPDVSGLTYRGKPANYSMRLGWQRHAPVPFEWIQPLSGPTTYHEHLETSGEGFHHLAFNVEDMDAAIRQWESWGYPHSMGGAWGEKDKPGSGRFAYHDLRAIGGTEIELLWNYRAPATRR